MSIASCDHSDPRHVAQDRERLRYQIVREWRSAGRFDYSDAELEVEVASRMSELNRRRQATPQLQLPLIDVGQVPAETKRDSCRAGRQNRLGRRNVILELLEKAGPAGMTRAELATELGVESGSVCAPIKYLVDQGLVCQPHKKLGPHGVDVAVVVLRRHASGGTTNARA